MDIGKICSITFGDVVGTFLIGMMMGAAICILVQMAFSARLKGEQ